MWCLFYDTKSRCFSTTKKIVIQQPSDITMQKVFVKSCIFKDI